MPGCPYSTPPDKPFIALTRSSVIAEAVLSQYECVGNWWVVPGKSSSAVGFGYSHDAACSMYMGLEQTTVSVGGCTGG